MARRKGINATIRDYVAALKAENDRMRAALETIACPSQTDDLLWWQQTARAALHPTTEEKEG